MKKQRIALILLALAALIVLFAACLFISIPALIIYMVFNKTITTNVSFGGLKG